MLLPISKIAEYKKSETAIFLGCAESIHYITPKQWGRISEFDTWTSNNFHYHPFVPKFYHVEMKQRRGWDKIWIERRERRKKDYGDVIFIVPDKRQYILDAIGEHKEIFYYKTKLIDKEKVKRPDPDYEFDKDPNVLTKVCMSSVTCILEILCRLGYKKIILLGVDYTSSRYFWSDRPEYGLTHCHHNKDFEGRKEEEPHNTVNTISFMIGFNRNYLEPNGCKMYVGYKETLLYPALDYLHRRDWQ